jgi:hypothetical protein
MMEVWFAWLLSPARPIHLQAHNNDRSYAPEPDPQAQRLTRAAAPVASWAGHCLHGGDFTGQPTMRPPLAVFRFAPPCDLEGVGVSVVVVVFVVFIIAVIISDL